MVKSNQSMAVGSPGEADGPAPEVELRCKTGSSWGAHLAWLMPTYANDISVNHYKLTQAEFGNGMRWISFSTWDLCRHTIWVQLTALLLLLESNVDWYLERCMMQEVCIHSIWAYLGTMVPLFIPFLSTSFCSIPARLLQAKNNIATMHAQRGEACKINHIYLW